MPRAIIHIPLLLTFTVQPIEAAPPASASGGVPIPTKLEGPDEEDERPNPFCGACAAKTDTTTQNGSTTGAVGVVNYVDDDGSDPYVGELAVKACFADEPCMEVHRAWVTIAHQSSVEITLQNGANWNWGDDVECVVYKLLTPQ